MAVLREQIERQKQPALNNCTMMDGPSANEEMCPPMASGPYAKLSENDSTIKAAAPIQGPGARQLIDDYSRQIGEYSAARHAKSAQHTVENSSRLDGLKRADNTLQSKEMDNTQPFAPSNRPQQKQEYVCGM